MVYKGWIIGCVCQHCATKTWSQVQLCRRNCYVGDSMCAQCFPSAATVPVLHRDGTVSARRMDQLRRFPVFYVFFYSLYRSICNTDNSTIDILPYHPGARWSFSLSSFGLRRSGIGDRVQTRKSYSKIFAFMDNDPKATSVEYMWLKTAAGRSVRLTGDHIVYAYDDVSLARHRLWG